MLTRRESRIEPSDFYVHAAVSAARRITDFADPAPQPAGVTQRLVACKRGGGVELGGTL